MTASRKERKALPRVSTRFDTDLTLCERLDARILTSHAAANKLRELYWGAPVVEIVEPCVEFFWDEQCELAIAKEQVNRARWMMLRRGTWTAQWKRGGAVPPEFNSAFDRIASLLKEIREVGRPSKERHHDLVGASVFVARFFAGEKRAPRLSLIADYLTFPEWGYPLPRDRISDIAYHALREVRTKTGPERYVLTATVIESFAPLLRRMPADWLRVFARD
jgi:hypothetical protein